ncbi:MAG: Ldh family oxidoreductase, partial [Caldilineaceae bacterium]|nr:Ldh family oxidoreductase [Caldilineaceae bacterium]
MELASLLLTPDSRLPNPTTKGNLFMSQPSSYKVLVPADELHQFVESLFLKGGFAPAHAADAANVLMYASRRGVDTHGIRNVMPIYFRQLEAGQLNVAPNFHIEHETPVSARANGDSGLGLAAGCWGMRLAMQKARQSGIGMVSMHNSYHYGAAGYYPWLAVQEDLIGISMTGRIYAGGAEYGVPPTFGAKAMFSTNPLSISFPTQNEPPYVFDMATSVVPFNRITMMRDAGQSIPLGWGVTADGSPSTDPGEVAQVLPLGGSREQGGHKGYGLATMVTVLCNLLSGGWAGLYDNDPQAFEGFKLPNDGHFFAAFRVDLFRPLAEFKEGMDAMIRALHASPKLSGHDRIYVAGEIEHETDIQRLHDGIPVTETVFDNFVELAE